MDLDRGSIVGSDDADRPVLLEGGQLHLLHALEAVLPEGCVAITEIDALAGKLGLEPSPVSTDRCRFELEEAVAAIQAEHPELEVEEAVGMAADQAEAILEAEAGARAPGGG